MSHKEEKIPNYIDFPYDIFLMLRLEFLALCQDELEAKIMRIIEKAINDEWERIYRVRCASTPKNEPVKMPEQVWVVIPNRYFLDRLLGTVQSETTLKAAMKSLIQKKRFIFRRERRGRYEAPEYTLNKKALTQFFATLPADPRQLDMKIIMKQERKKNIKEGDQLLTPSKPDPIISEGVKKWPHEHQKLTPSAPIIDPLVELGGDLLLTPTYIDLDSNLDDKLECKSALSDDERASPTLIAHPLHSFLFVDDPIVPTTLTCFLTSKEYQSDMEDKKRGWIAQEVKWELEQKGHYVEYRWERETESKVVNAESSHHMLPIGDQNDTSLVHRGTTRHDGNDLECGNANSTAQSGTGDQNGATSPQPTTSTVETQDASYRRQGEDHEHIDDSLAPSIPAHPDPARAEVNSLHTDAYQDIVAPPQQGEVTPPVGETAQAQQLERQASDNKPEKPVQATRGGNVEEKKPRTGPPQMPPTEMEWGPEKMVQITEARRFWNNKRGAYFSEAIQGKKGRSQRDRQLEAAKKILALQIPNPQTGEMEGITEAMYIKAFDARNDEWWNTTQGPLSVEHMYAKTTNHEIRIIEVLEKLNGKSTNVGRSGRNIVPLPTEMNEAKAQAEVNNQKQLEKLRQRAVQKATAQGGVTSYAV